MPIVTSARSLTLAFLLRAVNMGISAYIWRVWHARSHSRFCILFVRKMFSRTILRFICAILNFICARTNVIGARTNVIGAISRETGARTKFLRSRTHSIGPISKFPRPRTNSIGAISNVRGTRTRLLKFSWFCLLWTHSKCV